uniref:Uncharacterized protein n=1 Tax=Rhizophora mucronata TaxID=61149 RepID=A0A2P2N5E8_RHIMU
MQAPITWQYTIQIPGVLCWNRLCITCE